MAPTVQDIAAHPANANRKKHCDRYVPEAAANTDAAQAMLVQVEFHSHPTRVGVSGQSISA